VGCCFDVLGMSKDELDKEIAYWSYQKKTSIIEGDLAGVLESDKNIKKLLEEDV
jgi:hypothetical protein